MQLETVIVVSEIPHERSELILILVLQADEWDEEIRAGAAWGLGQFDSERSAAALMNTFSSNKREIQIEAARALLRITTGRSCCPTDSPELLETGTVKPGVRHHQGQVATDKEIPLKSKRAS